MKFALTIFATFTCIISYSQIRDFSAYDTAGNYSFKLIDSLQKKIKTQPKNALLYYQRSELMLNFIYNFGESQHTINDVMKDINKAIQLKPDTADFYVWRSHCYEYYESIVDSMKAAINDMTKAINLVPNNASFYKRRAGLNMEIDTDRNIICADLKKSMELGDEEAKEIYLKGCKQNEP